MLGRFISGDRAWKRGEQWKLAASLEDFLMQTLSWGICKVFPFTPPKVPLVIMIMIFINPVAHAELSWLGWS